MQYHFFIIIGILRGGKQEIKRPHNTSAESKTSPLKEDQGSDKKAWAEPT